MWLLREDPYLIHLNAGLHDLKTIAYGDTAGANLIPINQYKENLKRIFDFIHTRTKEKCIWATTTPVINERARQDHSKYLDFERYNVDVIRYNEAAVTIANDMQIPINDLYSFVMKNNPDTIICNDGVHYTDAGYQMLAQVVATEIKKYI